MLLSSLPFGVDGCNLGFTNKFSCEIFKNLFFNSSDCKVCLLSLIVCNGLLLFFTYYLLMNILNIFVFIL